MTVPPNQPAAPNAGIASQLTIEHHWPGVGEPERDAVRHMATRAKIIGVHAAEADEPVHLIELLVEGGMNAFDIGEVTQEAPGQPRSNWQVPYDERVLEESNQSTRLAFFFHYLDFERPLLTPAGSLLVPTATKVPAHLKDIEYESS